MTGFDGKGRFTKTWRTMFHAGFYLIIGVSMLAALRAFSRSVIYPGSAVPFPSEERLARDGIELLRYRSSDGIDLQSAYRRARQSDAPIIVYLHANAESAAENLDLCVTLGDYFGVALPEYRGYGGQAGSPNEQGLYTDALAAIDALRSVGVASDRIVLVGRSLGTGVAVELASRGIGRALVLVSPYTSVVELGRSIVGPLSPLLVADRYDNAGKVGSIAVPAVVIHGTRDEVVPYRMGATIARLLPRGRLVTLSNVGHNDILDLPELLAVEIRSLLGSDDSAADK